MLIALSNTREEVRARQEAQRAMRYFDSLLGLLAEQAERMGGVPSPVLLDSVQHEVLDELQSCLEKTKTAFGLDG